MAFSVKAEGRMVVAWGLVSVGAALALLYGLGFCAARPSTAKTLVKTLSVAPLALAAGLFGAPVTITLGLALGAAGDFFLSRAGERSFLAGMAAFAAGHLAYALGFVQAGATLPGPGVLLPLAALGLSTEIWLAPHTGGLRWPVRGYVVVILLMAAAAFGLPPGAIMLGAALFVLSDLILALDLFRFGPDRPNLWRARMLWAAYWAGQLLILLGMAGLL
jgi:uncharacterized membrane protein YhhN